MNVRRQLLPILALALLPLLWLWPHAIGQRRFVPYDLAEFPPAGQQLTHQQYADLRAGTNHDVTEVPVWFLPELGLARDELRAGRLPTWNAHARGGAPLHAHGLLGLCYPPNWLVLFADDPGAWLWLLAWISLTVAGFGAFGLFRELQIATLPAWFGAATFQLAAPLAANAFFWMRLGSFVWLPMLLWALLRLTKHDTLRALPTIAVAVTFALPWLSGFPPFAASTTVIAGLFVVWLTVTTARRDGRGPALQVLLRTALAIGLGALLTLPQVLPSLLFFPESARNTAPSLAQHQLSRFDLYGLSGYLLPDLIGHPTADRILPYGKSPLALWLCDRLDNAGNGALPNYNYTEYSVFFGSLGFVLAVFGAIWGRGRHRAFALATFVLLLCLALFVPVVNQLYCLPLIGNVWPMRWLAPGTLLLAWCVALGLQRLLDAPRPAAWWLGGVMFALGVALWWLAGRPAAWHAADPDWWQQAIAARVPVTTDVVRNYVQEWAPPGLDRFVAAGERAAAAGREALLWYMLLGAGLLAFARWHAAPARRWCLGALLATGLLQLVLHGAPLLHGIEPGHEVETPVHAFLRQQAAAHRDDGGFTIARASLGEMQQEQLPPGQLLGPGIRDLHFYTHFDGRSLLPFATLLPGELGARNTPKGYLTTSLPQAVPGLLTHPYLDLCGVRYLLSIHELSGLGDPVGPPWQGPRGRFFVYERPKALPRAFAVPGLEVLPDDKAVLAALTDAALLPQRQVFVCATDPGAPAARRVSPPMAPRGVHFVTDTPTQIELQLDAGDEPWLVLADTFLPGWTASVDGVEVPLHRGNHWQRLVEVPPLACRVVFSYSAPGLSTGTWLAALGALALLLLGGRELHRRRT